MASSNTPRSALPSRTSNSSVTSSLHQDPYPHPRHPHTYPPPSHPYNTHHYESPSDYRPPQNHHHHQHHQHHHHQHHHQHQTQQHQRFQSTYDQNQDLYSSSLPADSFPRTFPRSAYDRDRHDYQQPLSPSSFAQPLQQRHYHLHHQSSYPPLSSSSYSESTSRNDIAANNSSDGQSSNFNNISSNLPEYTYPMTPSMNLHQVHHRPSHLRQYHAHSQERSHMHHSQSQGHVSRPPSKEHPYLSQQPDRHHAEPEQGQGPPAQKPRSLIRTSWSNDTSHDCPPQYQSGSNQSISMRNTDSRISHATPRSMQVSVSILRSLACEPYQFSESPIDYRENNILPHSANSAYNKNGHEDHGMAPYSEQGNIDGLDSENDDYEENDAIYSKRQKIASSETNSLTYALPISKSAQSNNERNADPSERFQVDDEDEEEARMKSTSSSHRQFVFESGVRKDPLTKSKKGTKVPSQKRGSRRTLSLGEALDKIEDEAQAGTPQSSAARGLRSYAQRVCERVQAKGSTSYIELVHELCGGTAGENAPDIPETTAQENIRRRVYDALNVLEATGIISFDNKDIRWVGADESPVIRDVPTGQIEQPLASSRLPGSGRDDESEEPEDDDMDIEQLEREIGAMKRRNELEQAKLQDQLTRQVQLVSLVKRNRRKEAKDEEREERRRLRKEEKRRARAVDEDSSMADVGPQCSSDHNDETRPKPERHRRRRSPRHTSDRIECQEGEGVNDLENGQVEDEEARRRRKKERRERRERKAQRRLENEKNRIQLPFVLVRMPGYTTYSSDSESNISVVRSVRRGQTPNQRNEHGESTDLETTIVEIQVSQQEEPIVMSDTEILGDLGFNTLTIDELETILPKEFVDVVQYTENAEERQQSPCSHQRVQSSDMTARHNSDDSVMTGGDATGATSVTIQGGFEREFVRAASEGNSTV